MAAVGTLSDGFNASARDTSKWPTLSTGTMTWTNSGGRAIITPPALSVANDDCKIDSAAFAYDLTGSSAFVRLYRPSGNNSSSFIVSLQASGNNRVEWIHFSTTIYAHKRVAGVETDLASFTYDSTKHVWFKISESGGNTTWYTSVNGVDWTAAVTVANPIILTALTVSMECTTWSNNQVIGTFEYDDFNVPPTNTAWLKA